MSQRNAIVLGGKTGLLGRAIVAELTKRGWNVQAPGRDDLDMFSCDALSAYVDEHEPHTLFNAIAYTKVDQAEDEVSEARRINEGLPRLIGRVLASRPVRCFQISTDFVFNGKKARPYPVDAEPDPQSVYGKTKLDGEKALLDQIPERTCIARTAWLFGPGKRNFVETIITLCNERDALNIVHDQIGSPTYTVDLASMCADIEEKEATGIFHLVNSGQASWCELAAEAAMLAEVSCSIQAIPSEDYPQKATRPAYSVLDTSRYTEVTGKTPRPWAQALRDYVFHDLWDSLEHR